MTNPTAPVERPGHSNAPTGAARPFTLLIAVHDRPGALDRVVGLFRRRRANLETLIVAHDEIPDIVHVTAAGNDAEVAVEHLVEQLRKIVDVRHVESLTAQQAIIHELALIKVNSSAENLHAIIEAGHQSGASVVDITSESVTLEASGSKEKIAELIQRLQKYGIRELARSGSVVMARDVAGNEVSTDKTEQSIG